MDVSGDCMICIQDKTGTIRTHIYESDYEAGGYKANGWVPVETDWTKTRYVKDKVDAAREIAALKHFGK